MFGNEPIGTALLWPPVLLWLTTALLASGRASLASRAQLALYTYQGSRPIVTTCAANHGPSHVVFSLGGSAMLSPLSPSCRLAERPLKHLSIVKRIDHHGGTVSAHLVQIIGFSKVFRKLYLCYTSVYSFVTVLCQVGHIKLPHFVLLFNRVDSHFISRFPAFFSPDPQHQKPDPETRLKTLLISMLILGWINFTFF